MAQGHVFGWARSDMSIGAKIAWLPASIQPKGGGIRDWLTGERLETVEPGHHRLGSPMYPAWRCDGCCFILFSFEQPEQAPSS